MAQSDALKKYLDAGMAFTQLTRARAEQIVKDLVAAGELQQKQSRAAIDELVDRSRQNAEAFGDQVRAEVNRQLGALGLATQDDIARLEGKIATIAPTPAPKAPAPAPKAPVAPTPPVAKRAPAAPAAPLAPVVKKAAPAKAAPAKAAPAKAAPAKGAAAAKKASKKG